MNTVNLVKCALFGILLQSIHGIYTYDRFHNRGIATDLNNNHPYYTSHVFHSVEFASKNSTLKLRTLNLNGSKSLPEIIL